jgi:hypothetical protein
LMQRSAPELKARLTSMGLASTAVTCGASNPDQPQRQRTIDADGLKMQQCFTWRYTGCSWLTLLCIWHGQCDQPKPVVMLDSDEP